MSRTPAGFGCAGGEDEESRGAPRGTAQGDELEGHEAEGAGGQGRQTRGVPVEERTIKITNPSIKPNKKQITDGFAVCWGDEFSNIDGGASGVGAAVSEWIGWAGGQVASGCVARVRLEA